MLGNGFNVVCDRIHIYYICFVYPDLDGTVYLDLDGTVLDIV